MKISRPILVNSTLAVVTIGALVGGYFLIVQPTSAASDESTQLTSTVQEGAVTSSITASGSIAPLREVSASFAVSGTIATVTTSLGATVAAGDVIGTLDTADLDAALAKANTNLANAQNTLADAKDSYADAVADAAANPNGNDQSSSAKQQVTSAQSQVNDATDAVTTATNDLASATLTAPIAGLVVALTGEVGGNAPSGGSEAATGFATIADVSKMTVTANIAEADIASVAVGQAAAISFPALPDLDATATVAGISPTATASNSVVTYATTITLDTIPEGLRLGQTADVSITTESSADDALYVPTAAITTSADGTSTVDVVDEDGETSTVTVELGVVGDAGTEVTSGLTAGQTVVIGTVAATTDSTGTETVPGGGQGNFPGGGTPPTGGNFPGGGQ